MLTPQERRLLLLLAAWLAAGSALDALSLARPELVVPLVGTERFADLLASGREEPAVPASPAAAADSAGALGRQERPRASATRRGRPLAYDARGRLDLNRADSTELDLVDGIGPALASRILAERARRGGFRRAEDLLAVRGIGPRTLAKLLPQLAVGAPVDTDSAGRATRKQR
jgi:competence ComEA-like helix-hairpin-helix protein